MLKEKWLRRYAKIAKEASTWSKDPSTKVGAVIIDPDKRPVSFGFNGLPKCIEDTHENLNNREFKISNVVHAEQNAIDISDPERLKDATIVVTHFPCERCAKSIGKSGIKYVVVSERHESYESRWKDSIKEGLRILKRYKVEVILLDSN